MGCKYDWDDPEALKARKKGGQFIPVRKVGIDQKHRLSLIVY